MARVRSRKDDIVLKSPNGVEAWLRGLDRAEVIQGSARFVAPRTVQIGECTLAAPRIFINVGGRPAFRVGAGRRA